MEKYLLVYSGGKQPDPKDSKKVMDAWNVWFKIMGKGLVDGGAPTMPVSTITSAGIKKGVMSDPVTGYSVITADNMDAANKMAKSSPHLAAGGTITVCQLMPMMM